MVDDNNGSAAGNNSPENGDHGPSFRLILVTVLILTLVSLVFAALVVYWMSDRVPPQGFSNDDARTAALAVREAAKLISDKLMDVFVLGCGAIIGLLGGRSAK